MYSQPKLHRVLLAAITANLLTWYEFSLYIQFAPLFARIFFPSGSLAASLISVFFVFALGFISRPLGTLFFSHVGDKLGRKAALIFSIIFITFPTFAIGLLPTYVSVGIAAPILLALMRLFQGFASGGEFPGLMCYFFEISPKSSRSFVAGLTFFGTQVGTILSIVEFLILERVLSPEDFAAWGWRLSFILGGAVGLIALHLRYRLEETPGFEMIKTEGKLSKRPILEALQEHRRGLAKAFFLSCLTSAGWFLIFVFSPIYLSQMLGMKASQQLYVNGGLLLLSTFFLPLFGYLGDLTYKKTLFVWSGIVVFVLAIPLYFSAAHNSFVIFFILEILMNLLMTVQFALLPVILCELFPLRVRYSSVGLSYNFSNILFGGITPVVALSLTEKTGDLISPAFILMAAAALSVLAFFTITKQDLRHLGH